MSPSFEDINYSLRPNKCVERKMLCEAFRKLVNFAPLDSYQYVGFGSTYFSDFVLFHKELALSDMKSIEREVDLAARFELNRPYQCVRIFYGESAEILPNQTIFDWTTKRAIVWLDYDGDLQQSELADIKTLATNLLPGSVFLISVRAEPGREDTDRLGNLQARVGAARIPMGVERKDLTATGYGNVIRDIITNEIDETLSARNGTLEEEEQVSYNQLFNFRYADNAKMMTVGGILTHNNQDSKEKLELCKFGDLPFVSANATAVKIEVPNLTWREIRQLDRALPHQDHPVLDGVPPRDIARYAKIYRYFPAFSETSF